MKKLSISLMGVVFALVLVGCGGGTDRPTDPTPAPAQQGGDAEVVDTATDGEVIVEVDEEYTAALGQCLTDNGVVMYGTSRCSHCNTQRAAFGAGFDNVTDVDCDEDRQACLDAGVRGYPTWIDADGNPYPGTQTLTRLAAIGGCEDIQ